ncbi:hypothetical protein DsansV1_C12g0116221 [Dioscorea sansibarensis]
MRGFSLGEMHFVKWLRTDLKMQGFSCSLSDKSRLRDVLSLAVARATMDTAALGIVLVMTKSFSNLYSIEELQNPSLTEEREEEKPEDVARKGKKPAEDWWDGRNVMELLPRLGGETHFLISIRLPHALSVRPRKLLHLSSSEAMSFMRGILGHLLVEDIVALRAIEEKLSRLHLALGFVGAVFAELQARPYELLEKIDGMPYSQPSESGNKEELVLTCNPFLVTLLDFCFSIFDQTEKPKRLALRMIWSSSQFSPTPVLVLMLSLARKGISGA